MLDRYDAFDVTSKSIRSESTLSETSSSRVKSICCLQPGWRGKVWWCKSSFTLKLIRPKSIRPNWGQFDHGQFVCLLLLLTWIYFCRSGGTFNLTLPFMTNVTISISTSQIFRSWVAIFQPRPPMVSLFRSLYSMPGLAPRMDVLS